MENLKYEYGLKSGKLFFNTAFFGYMALSAFGARDNYPDGITFFNSIHLDASQAAVLMYIIGTILILIVLINLHGLYVFYKNPNRFFELNSDNLSIPHLILPNSIKIIPFNEISTFNISSKRLKIKHNNKYEILEKRFFKQADEFEVFINEFSKRMEQYKTTP